MLKILQKEERKNRKQWKKNKQALDALMGAGEKEISSDEDDGEEKQRREEIDQAEMG